MMCKCFIFCCIVKNWMYIYILRIVVITEYVITKIAVESVGCELFCALN